MGAWHAEMFPAMGQAEEWMLKHRDFTFPINQRLEVPMLCLRWTHDCINHKMMFGEDGSIFKLVDQLQRGNKGQSRR